MYIGGKKNVMINTRVCKAINTDQDISDLPPQARAIVEEVRNSGVIKRDDLLSKLEERFSATGARQPAKNIFSFYRGNLIKQGFMCEITL